MSRWLLAVVVGTLVGCGGGDREAEQVQPADTHASRPAAEVHDPHSFGNPHEVRVTHVALDLDVDFDSKSAR